MMKIAVHTIAQVLQQKASLASLMKPAQAKVEESDRARLQELCFGTLRWQPQLQSILSRLMDKPLKDKDADIQALLLMGLYQIKYMRTPDHAVIDGAVKTTKALKKTWASKLINGVLRQFQRQRETLEAQLASSPSFVSAHPNWLRKQIENFWPQHASDIFNANNGHPPFTLRLASSNRDDYRSKLPFDSQPTPFSPHGITLDSATDVFNLPGFEQGLISVQDEAAQLAAALLDLKAGQRVLDACCAPGGKTGHILETEPQLKELVALDLEERRLGRVRENLQRLKKQATIVCCDAAAVDQWWDDEPFDRILLDAPCSATGVIRRHPDIKVLRKASDIAKLAALQLSLLNALWPTLKPGGRLVYATCSLLPTENTEVIAQFMAQHDDAQHRAQEVTWGLSQPFGRQLLPQPKGHDGFYYAVIDKDKP